MSVSRGTPQRIQRRRTKGWRMPEGAVYVGRPSRWANPWPVGLRFIDGGTMERPPSIAWFRSWAETFAWLRPDWIASLRGRDLACWCPLDQPCHADVLLELANR